MAPSATSPVLITATPHIVDDKSPHCIPFILSRLKVHQAQHKNKPFFIGLNGVQGAGKTTLVSALQETLSKDEGLQTLVCSIDELYLNHDDQVALAKHHALNPLVQHRGEPGTHDMVLAEQFFSALQQGRETKVPQYDKSAFCGQGDRVPSSEWRSVNGPSQPKAEVIIFEGWNVGFRALPDSEVAAKQKRPGNTTLRKHRLEDLQFINEKLKGYEVMNKCFDAFIHIDALETGYVYDWRQQQEAALRRDKGTGMSEQEVVTFVDGYYPAYELFTEALREGIFKGKEDGKGKQLRLIVNKDRKVKQVITI